MNTLVSCGHCVVCPSSIYGFRWTLWYLVVIVLSVPLLFTASDEHFGILSLCCLSLFYLRLQMTTLVSCGYCAVCPSSIYGFRWPLWYLLVIVLSVPVRFTTSDDHSGILSLCCLSLFDLRLQINTGILWSLCCLSLFYLRLQMTTLVSFGHCAVCPSSIYGFRWTLLVSCGHCAVCPSSIYGFRWPLLVSCGHCAVCPSSIYGFRWPLWYLVIVLSVPLLFTASDEHWYLVVIVLSVRLLFTASDDHFGIL
jgi:hypothetical protein